ncbi:MAG: DNA cytosine methyltransferase [Bacteroidetes bacterium]|nr:DNA cytosine methyltransferase [Bacteroidota bacterium]
MDYTTQHITRNHNDRDLEIYSLAIDKWINERQRLKYNDIPKHLQTHKNTIAFLDRIKQLTQLDIHIQLLQYISKDGHYYIYLDKETGAFYISVREAARIQSFPDDYYFEGGKNSSIQTN